jgi:hypothetical protein
MARTYDQRVGPHRLTLDVDLQAAIASVTADGYVLAHIPIGAPPVFLGPYHVDNELIEFIQIGSGGAACFAQFYAVTFAGSSALSKAFGTCSDEPHIVQGAHSVTLSLAAPGGATVDYVLDAAGLHEHRIADNTSGPALSAQSDLAALVLNAKDVRPLKRAAPTAAVKALVGPTIYADLQTCSVDEAPASIPPYVVAESLLSPSCRYPGVYFVFDHGRNAWVGTQATPDADITWYGHPPAAVIQAVKAYDNLPGH